MGVGVLMCLHRTHTPPRDHQDLMMRTARGADPDPWSGNNHIRASLIIIIGTGVRRRRERRVCGMSMVWYEAMYERGVEGVW
jgi:hypothetical protein